MKSASLYPDTSAQRDQWILQRRGPRNAIDPSVPYGFFVEEECLHTGEVGSVATILLTNRECPWRCAMCDLWKNTLTAPVPSGSIPQQIKYALSRLPAARQVKLYNSGSFFDAGAIPVADYSAIASLVNHFDRVIVESHPALISDLCFKFGETLSTKLEVAMGLETVHPLALEKLNKRMTLEQYRAAADKLSVHNIDLRSFILVQPPFVAAHESLDWACRSIDFAVACQATAITLLPTRGGNGAMEDLASNGDFAPPSLSVVEDAQDYGLSRRPARVCVDLWDIQRVKSEDCCRAARLDRIKQVNLTQTMIDRVACSNCA